MADRTPDDDLIFDLGYGLKRAGLRMPIEACRAIAGSVLEHLKLARWRFEQIPPDEAHGSFMPEKSARADEVTPGG
jgi:hypothetical protein